MQGMLTVATNTTKRRTNSFKRLTTIQLGILKSTAMVIENNCEKKGGHFFNFSSGFRKILFQSDLERPRQAVNDRVEQFRHDMLK